MTRVLVLGASGMMGNTIFRVLGGSPGLETTATVRSDAARERLPEALRGRVVSGVDALDTRRLDAVLSGQRPDVVVNCIGIVKQLGDANDPLVTIPLNALLPHQLARTCEAIGARLIQLSTDCVFDGTGSMYRETDFASANDLYGRSKYLGEVDRPNAITLRTSTIGHELGSHHGLLEWFLAQAGPVRGYRKAIYSGLSTPELAAVIRDHVIPNPHLHGLYQVSGHVIDKFNLLLLIREAYGRTVAVEPDDRIAVDRSLDSSRFRDITGYVPPQWDQQIREMRRFG